MAISSDSPSRARAFRPRVKLGRGRGANRRITRAERAATWAVVAAAAGTGGAAGAHPAGWRPADLALSAAFAAVIALAGSRGRRWTWLVAAGVGAVIATDGFAVACGVVAVLLAFAAAVVDRRSPVIGAVVAGLAVQALLRLPEFGFHGAPSVVAALAVLPVLDSGYRYATRRERRNVRRATVGLSAVTVVLMTLLAVVALQVRLKVEQAIDEAQAGFEAVQDGNRDTAVTRLDDAARDFGSAANTLGAWWMKPVRVLPIAGHQAAAVESMAVEGHALAEVAASAATEVDYENLRVRGGAIDIAMLRSVQEPIAIAAAALEAAADHLDRIDAAWLLPPLQSRYDRLVDEVGRALPAARAARDVTAVAPAMLGGDGPRHYLVLFGTPSEARDLGGFVGNYAEVTAENGKLSLTRSGRSLELSNPSGDEGWTLEPGDYLDRFVDYQVTRFFGNVSGSPDFNEVAHVAGQIYPQATGVAVDGVFYMDPYTLAALLDLTGPVHLRDADVRLTEKNAAHFLLVEQYINLDEHKDRVDFLDEATRTVFEELTSGDLPSPKAVADVLSPMVQQGRLLGHATNPEEQALFHTLGFDGPFPPAGDGDFLSIVQANQGPNKIDAYLQRQVTYTPTFVPGTGEIEGTLRITFVNSAPAEGLPVEVIGNRHDRPPGTNQLYLTVYSALSVRGARLDGAPLGIGSISRFGYSMAIVPLDVPPGGTVALELDLRGVVKPSETYQLTVARQPTVNPDTIDVVLNAGQGWRIERSDDLAAGADGATVTVENRRIAVITALFARD